ncbi:Ras GTPase [Pelomyxa schiedti]|nr:Ras GTPase [Pelomyxa schiedti]
MDVVLGTPVDVTPLPPPPPLPDDILAINFGSPVVVPPSPAPLPSLDLQRSGSPWLLDQQKPRQHSGSAPLALDYRCGSADLQTLEDAVLQLPPSLAPTAPTPTLRDLDSQGFASHSRSCSQPPPVASVQQPPVCRSGGSGVASSVFTFGQPLTRCVGSSSKASLPEPVERMLQLLVVWAPVAKDDLFSVPEEDEGVQKLKKAIELGLQLTQNVLDDAIPRATPNSDDTVSLSVDCECKSALQHCTLASLLLLYLKMLPHPIIPPKHYWTIAKLGSISKQATRLRQVRVLVNKLPPVSRRLLSALLLYLHSTRISAARLATIFSRFFVRPTMSMSETNPTPQHLQSLVLLITEEMIKHAPFITLMSHKLAAVESNDDPCCLEFRLLGCALYDFDNDNGLDDVLTFKAGERLQIINAHSNEWLEGVCRGCTGFFPTNFVDLIPVSMNVATIHTPPETNIPPNPNLSVTAPQTTSSTPKPKVDPVVTSVLGAVASECIPVSSETPTGSLQQQRQNSDHDLNKLALTPLKSQAKPSPINAFTPPPPPPPSRPPPLHHTSSSCLLSPSPSSTPATTPATPASSASPAITTVPQNQSTSTQPAVPKPRKYPPRQPGERDNNDYKVCVVGLGGVGKSAFTISFVKDRFIEVYDPTIEDCYRKQVSVDDVDCLLNILDTAGQEELSTLRDQYMRTGQGFILMFSMTSRASFADTGSLFRHILEVKDSSRVPVIIVGNKADLPQEWRVTPAEANELARMLEVSFVLASAKTKINVEETFHLLVREIREYLREPEALTASIGGGEGISTGQRPKRRLCILL